MPVVPVLIVGWPICKNLLLRGLCVLRRVFNECTVMLMDLVELGVTRKAF